jgi:hypothetical protein
MKRNETPFAASILLLSLVAGRAPAEDLRVQIRGEAVPGGPEVGIAYADGVSVPFPEDGEFLDGLEFELKIPKAAQGFKGSFLVLFYKAASPEPSAISVSYAAERIASMVVPAKLSQAYQIPVRKDHGMKSSPYAASLPVVQPKDFPLIVRLMPAIKGLPEALEKAEFSVRAKPILRDEGRVSLSLEWNAGLDPGSAVEVSVDGEAVADFKKTFALKAGEHALRITGPDVRDEYIAFRLERGQRLALTALLKDVVPRLVLEFPEKTKVDMDGKRFEAESGTETVVTPGEHVLTFSVGDYSIQRKLLVKRGKTYRVSLLVDLRVEESD